MSDSSLISSLNQVPTDILISSGNGFENRIQTAKNTISSSKQNGELKKVAQDFEAVFIAQLLKVMRETIEESGLLEGGFGKSIYSELFDQEVSLSLAKRGTLGISNILQQSLSSKLGVPEDQKSGKPLSAEPPITLPVPSMQFPDNSGEGSTQESEISDLQLPVQAPVSSNFGMRRDPFSKMSKFHKGVDLAAPAGVKVVPALPGKVVFAGYENGYGNTVVVEHTGGLQTRYGHLGTINVRVGDTIASQDALGTVGNSGRSTGSHLHFEVIQGGTVVNPLASLNARHSVSAVREKS